MAITKNAIIRYQALDKCFRNPGRRFYIEDLLEICNEAITELDPKSSGIKKRQLYDDITFMESSQGWGIPLERVKDGRKTYFRYTDSSFSINSQPINELEAEQLKSAMMVLKRFKGMPQFEWINELLPKLDDSFKLSNHSDNIISFDRNEFLKGTEHLSPLFNAILYKQTLQITYQSFKSDTEQEIIFHPYHLKNYNNRWFLFGKSGNYENLTNLALDRINEIQNSNVAFIENGMLDFDEYFEDIIGVSKTIEDEPLKIELYATKRLAPYIKTKPLHGSQKTISETTDGYSFSIEVIPNYELEQLLLSFGEAIKILAPPEFKQKMKERVVELLANFN
ncbi:MAG TPA: WYL domain-containing protein [Muricauda sp.]|nr:WYL domain-containing protein [Allomuricauda sp.]HBU79066.1 WYL domain-containing protein [Allomuricauda sp.]|tara:strand:+ start:1451 stop:2461 length:1011 start_codon:yes stop_codon:yes gene_type:complete